MRTNIHAWVLALGLASSTSAHAQCLEWSEEFGSSGTDAPVLSMAALDDGNGSALYIGGVFNTAGTVSASRVAKWDGEAWSSLGSGTNGPVHAFAVYDDGSGPMLYVGGEFTTAGGTSVNGIARWDGESWSDVGGGVRGISHPTVHALIVFDDGTGPALYAGGRFWTAGGMSTNNIARWNGVAWTPLFGVGVFEVHAFAVFDDGSGSALYAGGSVGILSAGGVTKWNGATWSTFLAGPHGIVSALASFDDGSGAKLYAGGNFQELVGGAPSPYLAQWDGVQWSAVGGGVNGFVNALTVFDDGAGTALYVGGGFNLVAGNSIKRVAKWDGSAWSGLGAGVQDPIVYSLAVYDDGEDGAPDLYAGGSFSMVDGKTALRIAEWHGCPPGNAYCFGDGVDSVVTAQCPCGNFGDAGHGCANSNASLGGARLWATGTTSPNTLVLHCEGIPNNALGTFMRGTMNTAAGLVMGDGVQCATGTIIRFGQQPAGQNGNPSNTIAVGAATVAPGLTRYYQVQYRNPNAGFCPPEIFNFSNGYVVSW